MATVTILFFFFILLIVVRKVYQSYFLNNSILKESLYSSPTV
jgi:hypothetical protein